VLRYIEKTAGLQGSDPWDITFNYLGQLDTAVASGQWLSLAEESGGSGVSEEQISASKLSVDSYIFGEELVLGWNYSTRHFNKETITKLAGEYINQLKRLITHCLEHVESGAVYTPADYGLSAEVTFQELDRFLDDDDENIISFD